MIGIDTNILLRFLVDDDPAQSAISRRFMSERSAKDPAYISALVLTETTWFLVRRLNYPKAQIIGLLRQLMEVDGIVFEHSHELKTWGADLSRPVADIADYLIAWSASKSGCHTTMTFDKKAAARVPGMELLA